jgi:CheY-like chemotaxis protein
VIDTVHPARRLYGTVLARLMLIKVTDDKVIEVCAMSRLRNLIIVNDEAESRTQIRRTVSQRFASAEVFEASSGQEALKLYESHGADLMIIEHHIPLLDGLSLVRFLRAQEVKIPLFLISSNPQIERESVAAGATCFLDKQSLGKSLEGTLAGAFQ